MKGRINQRQCFQMQKLHTPYINEMLEDASLEQYYNIRIRDTLIKIDT